MKRDKITRDAMLKALEFSQKTKQESGYNVSIEYSAPLGSIWLSIQTPSGTTMCGDAFQYFLPERIDIALTVVSEAIKAHMEFPY